MISYDCAEQLNAILNHPEVHPFHLFDGEIDVSPVLARGGFGVVGEGFGFLLDPIGPGTVEVHTSVLPEFRHQSYAITMQAMTEVFLETTVTEIFTRIKDNAPARRLATAVGMQKVMERDGFEYFSISLTQWAADAPGMQEVGHQFHETLEAAGGETDHGEDANHDQYVGVAVSMAQAGNTVKAVLFYNQWAKLAGFHPATILSENTAFIGNAVIKITSEGVEVMQCP